MAFNIFIRNLECLIKKIISLGDGSLSKIYQRHSDGIHCVSLIKKIDFIKWKFVTKNFILYSTSKLNLGTGEN